MLEGKQRVTSRERPGILMLFLPNRHFFSRDCWLGSRVPSPNGGVRNQTMSACVCAAHPLYTRRSLPVNKLFLKVNCFVNIFIKRIMCTQLQNLIFLEDKHTFTQQVHIVWRRLEDGRSLSFLNTASGGWGGIQGGSRVCSCYFPLGFFPEIRLLIQRFIKRSFGCVLIGAASFTPADSRALWGLGPGV